MTAIMNTKGGKQALLVPEANFVDSGNVLQSWLALTSTMDDDFFVIRPTSQLLIFFIRQTITSYANSQSK
jgi:hypothetical protein